MIYPDCCPLAPESIAIGQPVRERLFRTRRGRTYRIRFLVDDDQVRILRIRGPGQSPVLPHDISE